MEAFDTPALRQLAMVRASLPDPAVFAQHVPQGLQQAIDPAAQTLRGADSFEVRSDAEPVAGLSRPLKSSVQSFACLAVQQGCRHLTFTSSVVQESVCNEVSALLTVMDVPHTTGQSIAQGVLTIDIVVLSQQVCALGQFSDSQHSCWKHHLVASPLLCCDSPMRIHLMESVTGSTPAGRPRAVLQQPPAPATG